MVSLEVILGWFKLLNIKVVVTINVITLEVCTNTDVLCDWGGVSNELDYAYG